MESQKESSWGTLGGIAAGVTGSTAVGAAVAADTMRKNEEIRAHNAGISSRNLRLTDPLVDAAAKRAKEAEKELDALKAQMEKEKLTLVNERPPEELMEGVHFSEPKFTFTTGGTMIIRTQCSATKSYKIAEKVPAVIDGCFAAAVYDGNTLVGCAYLNLPMRGVKKSCEIEGHCLEAREGANYTVVIFPVALWLTERYHAGEVEVDGELPISGELSWEPCAIHGGITWQDAVRDDKEWHEAALKAEKKAKAAKRNKRIITAIAAVVFIISVGAGIHKLNQIKQIDDDFAQAAQYISKGKTESATSIYDRLIIENDTPKMRYRVAEAYYENGLSFAQALEMLDSIGDYKGSAGLKAKMEPYLPYVGHYTCNTNNNMFITSDFVKKDGEVFWTPESNLVVGSRHLMGSKMELSDSMEAVETFWLRPYDYTASYTLADGKINFKLNRINTKDEEEPRTEELIFERT